MHRTPLLILTTLLLAGCGQSGALYFTDPPALTSCEPSHGFTQSHIRSGHASGRSRYLGALSSRGLTAGSTF